MQEAQQAIAILAKSIIKTMKAQSAHLPYDITFPSVIYQTDEKERYIIKKDGCDYAVPNALGITLPEGQNVWVKIPSNNMNQMHICGIRS